MECKSVAVVGALPQRLVDVVRSMLSLGLMCKRRDFQTVRLVFPLLASSTRTGDRLNASFHDPMVVPMNRSGTCCLISAMCLAIILIVCCSLAI